MANRSILISGGSIAGPALAYWLRRYGFAATIVERAAAPRSGGQAIDLRGTGRQVVERMGIMERIREAHTGAQGVYVVNSAGHPLVRMAADTMNGSGGLIAEIEILRGDLVRILYEVTRNEVECIFDDSITSLREDEGGVHVTFERSAPRVFDLVVGADGLHSAVRRLAFGDETSLLRDLGCYFAIFSTSNAYGLDGWELMYTMPGNRRMSGKTIMLYPVRHNQEVRAAFCFAAPDVPFDRHDSARQKQLVASAFAGEGWEIPRLLTAMQTGPEFYCDQVAQVQLDRWSRGRVVLLGDAAYCPSPLSGMGTSLALVGAYVLAGELAATDGEVYATAFTSYQRQMHEAVRRAQKFARGAHMTLLPKSSFQMWMAHRGMGLMTYGPFQRLATSGVKKAANAVTLKDYRALEKVIPASTSAMNWMRPAM